MNSVLSYPDRGPYGNSRYRGNCSGYVIRDLLLHYRPGLFCDPTLGGNTSADVVKELQGQGGGPEFVGLDLRLGFNLLKDRLIERLPREADFAFFHPPYHSMIPYSGPQGMWGRDTAPHPDDLSQCESYEEFLYKMQLACSNIYEGIRRGGHYAVLIGDMRKNGGFWHMSSDITQIAPGILEAVQIKVQHNCVSDSRQYSGSSRLIRIEHEYLLHFKKDGVLIGLLDATLNSSSNLQRLSQAVWKSLIATALNRLGGEAKLPEIYRVIEETAPVETRQRKRKNWEGKVRQVLQRGAEFRPAARGVWTLATLAQAA